MQEARAEQSQGIATLLVRFGRRHTFEHFQSLLELDDVCVHGGAGSRVHRGQAIEEEGKQDVAAQLHLDHGGGDLSFQVQGFDHLLFVGDHFVQALLLIHECLL